jgi:hypothetical protein
MEDTFMARIKFLLFVLALAAQVPLASATVTYQVGGCLPKIPTFSTIQGALNASPSPNVVEVCPGTYNEQIVMGGFPVTVEGISAGNLTGATIAVPAGGLQVSATNDFGQPMYAQVFVQSGGQEVNLTNLTIDGTGNNVTDIYVAIAGVFYLGSSGTLNHLTVQNQSGNGAGVGIWLEGGIPTAYVTVENSNVQAFDYAGIFAETNSSLNELTATIKGNYMDVGLVANAAGILLSNGETASVSGNLISSDDGVVVGAGAGGSVSKNTIVAPTVLPEGQGAVGILLYGDGVPLMDNQILIRNDGWGLFLDLTLPAAPITGNTIVGSEQAIEDDCSAGNRVHSNTILGAVIGILDSTVGTNTYYGVETISGGC